MSGDQSLEWEIVDSKEEVEKDNFQVQTNKKLLSTSLIEEFGNLIDPRNSPSQKFWTPLPGPQTEAYSSPADELFYGGAGGAGKMQPYYVVVKTPFGDKTMGDIKAGDQVSNPDGSVARVIAVHENGLRDVYRVHFIDGASTDVGLEHLWFIKVAGKRLKADRRWPYGSEVISGKVMTTKSIIDLVEQAKNDFSEGNRPQWPLIPLTEPIEFTRSLGRGTDLRDVDPYVLGAIIGDGSTTQSHISFTNIDEFLLLEVQRLTTGGRLSIRSESTNHNFVEAGELIDNLTRLGIMGKTAIDKFIPWQYKFSSVESRWKLIQGLMDTDGYVDDGGGCSYTSISKKLAEDVQWIARSLGFKATISSKNPFYKDDNGKRIYCNIAYTVYIQGRNTPQLFRLPRKKNRCKDEFNGGASHPMRRIIDVEYIGKEECRCITIDHPNGLYLTDDFIVTHNSDLLLGVALNNHKQAIIFRREYPQLRNFVDRSRQILAGKARYNQNDKIWSGLPNGQTLEFGAVQYESDVTNFQGRPHDFFGFDEIPEFTLFQTCSARLFLNRNCLL